MVLPSLGQAQLGARRGGVGERLKAIFAVFDATRAAAGDTKTESRWQSVKTQ